MTLYQLAQSVILRREHFGGMAFHTRRGVTLELDEEGFALVQRFILPRPLPPTNSAAYDLILACRRAGFLHQTPETTIAPPQGGPTDDVEQYPLDRLSAPEVVHIALTDRCDLACPGCYVPRGKEALSWSILQKLIDQLADLRVFQIALGGGEPTLYPQLVDVVAYARARSIVPNLTTHGGHLTQELLDMLAKAGIGQINVSLNGVSPAQNTGRGERAWLLAMRGLRLLADSSIPYGVNSMVTQQSLPALPELLAELHNEGVQHVTILEPKPAADPTWSAIYMLHADDYPQLHHILHEWSDRITITIDCALVRPLLAHLPDGVLKGRGIYGCAAAQRICMVDTGGNVWPCSFQRSSQFCAGNIHHTPFADLWNHSIGFTRMRLPGNRMPCRECRV